MRKPEGDKVPRMLMSDKSPFVDAKIKNMLEAASAGTLYANVRFKDKLPGTQKRGGGRMCSHPGVNVLS